MAEGRWENEEKRVSSEGCDLSLLLRRQSVTRRSICGGVKNGTNFRLNGQKLLSHTNDTKEERNKFLTRTSLLNLSSSHSPSLQEFCFADGDSSTEESFSVGFPPEATAVPDRFFCTNLRKKSMPDPETVETL